jgi:plastocyanin
VRIAKLTLAVSAVIGAAVLTPTLAFGGAHAASGPTVSTKGIRFTPSTVTIRRGQTVTWRFNDGSTPHNVTATHFRSSSTKSSGSYTVRFTRAGTYSYVCTIHPGMRGKVVVH